MALSGTAGAASLGVLAGEAGAEEKAVRDYYELRRYEIETEEQKKGFLSFMAEAAIPALNRIGIEPVGVFQTPEELGPLYLLLTHPSMVSVATATQKLGEDAEFLAAGAGFLDAPSSSPAYARVSSSLLLAFTGMPRIEKPAKGPGRVFQLRVYESPSVKTGQKKIEMFNTGEIEIFRKTGLNPVFFGEALVGEKIPNLTYMLGFESMDEQKAAWNSFRDDPDWKALSAKPEYANDKILCGITNIALVAAACSQI